MGNNDHQQRREYDPRDIGPDVGLQIIPVTPTRDEERKDRWQPGWKIDDVIRNGRLPSKNDPKPIIH